MLARLITCLLLAGLVASAAGADTVINNGLAPPNSANVIVGGDLMGERFRVHNAGCDSTVESPCASPGAPTTASIDGYTFHATVHETSTLEVAGDYSPGFANAVDAYDQSSVRFGRLEGNVDMYDQSTAYLEAGAYLVWGITLHDDSQIVASGGWADTLTLLDNSSATLDGILFEYSHLYTTGSVVTSASFWRFNVGSSANVSVTGGIVGDYGHTIVAEDTSTVSFFDGFIGEPLSYIETDVAILSARGAASIFLYGGTVATGLLEITDSAVMTIFGTNFTVDGIPVAYGPLAMSNGLLEGVLQSGDALLGNPFLTTGGGQIVLAAPVPEPGTALLVGLGLAGLTAYRRRVAKHRV